MAIPADAGGFVLPRGAQPLVLCASCGARFDADGAITGDRVRCPLCAEVVELAGAVAEKRHYRARTPLDFGVRRAPPRRRERRSVPRRTVIVLVLAAYFVLWIVRPEWSPAWLWNQFKHW